MNIAIPRRGKEIKLSIPDGLTDIQIKDLVDTHWEDLTKPQEIKPEVAPAVSTAVAPGEAPQAEERAEFKQALGTRFEQLRPAPIARRAYEWGREKLVGARELDYPEMEPSEDPLVRAEQERLALRAGEIDPISLRGLKKISGPLIGAAIAPTLISAPVATIIGMGAYTGISELLNVAASVRGDVDWKLGAGKGISELIGVKGGAIKTTADAVEFVGKIVATGKAVGSVGKVLMKEPFFKTITNREKGLLTLDVAKKAKESVDKMSASRPNLVLTLREAEGLHVKAARSVVAKFKGMKDQAKYFRDIEKGLKPPPGEEGGTLGMTLFPLPWFKGKPKAWSVSSSEAFGAAFGDLNLKGFIKFAKGKGVEIKSLKDARDYIPLVQAYMSTHFDSVTPKGSRFYTGVPVMKGKPGGTIEKLYGLMDEIGVKKAGAKLTDKYHAELQRRVKITDRILMAELKAGAGERAFFTAKGKGLKGPMEGVEFEPLRPYFAQRELDQMFVLIGNYRDKLFTRMHAQEALTDILDGKAVKSKTRLRALSKIFGPEFVRSLQKRRPIHERATEQVLDALNAPRAILASGDISATLRQGIFLVTRHPIIASRAFRAQMKALLSEDAAIAVDKSLDMGKFALLREESGLYRAPLLYRGGALAERAEPFMSNIASKLPIVKQSERAFITFTNKLRADAFDHIAGKWEGTGKGKADYKALASFMNAATGRGNLGKWGETGGAILNAAFFSPRFFVSRFQVPYALVSGTPASRKYAAGTITSFVGTGLTVMGLAKLGGADVETDPRSSDFGKIRIGRTRYDYFGNYISIARYTAQIAKNERKSLVSGRIYKIPGGRISTMGRFLRSKTSPPIGLFWDFLSGETFRGEEFTPRSLKKLWKEGTPVEKLFDNPIWRRTMFMAVQDLTDAIRFQSLDGGYASRIGAGVSALPAFLGVGVQTYERSKWEETYEKKESLGLNYYGRSWDDLSRDAQKIIRRNHPEIESMEREAKFEMREKGGVLDLRRITEEQADAARKVQERLDPKFQEEIKRLGMIMPGLSRNLGTWRLNDERYGKYKHFTSVYLNHDMAKEMSRKAWQGYDDDKKRDRLEDTISKAKSKARRRVEKEAGKEMPK